MSLFPLQNLKILHTYVVTHFQSQLASKLVGATATLANELALYNNYLASLIKLSTFKNNKP